LRHRAYKVFRRYVIELEKLGLVRIVRRALSSFAEIPKDHNYLWTSLELQLLFPY